MYKRWKGLGITNADVLNAPKVLRTHCYCQHPFKYDIECPLCGGKNVTWSEFESHIWCYDCEKDICIPHRYAGIFGGPIPMQATRIFGISFDRINIKTNEIVSADYIFDGHDKDTRKRKDLDIFYNSTWVRDKKLFTYENMISRKIDKYFKIKIKKKKEKQDE